MKQVFIGELAIERKNIHSLENLDIFLEKMTFWRILHNFFSDFSQKSLHAYTKSPENRMVIGILAIASIHEAYTMPTLAYIGNGNQGGQLAYLQKPFGLFVKRMPIDCSEIL